MDDLGITYELESIDEFWSEIEDILNPLDGRRGHDDSYRQEIVLTSVKTFISFCGQYLGSTLYREGEDVLDYAVGQLITSKIYNDHWQAAIGVVIDRLTRKEFKNGPTTSHGASSSSAAERRVVLAILLADGNRQGKIVWKTLSKDRGVWTVLLAVLQESRVHHDQEKRRRRQSGSDRWGKEKMDIVLPCVKVLFEFCRVQRLSEKELAMVDDDLIEELLEDIEETPGQLYESFNVATILFLLALNEQYMVASVPKSDSSEKVKSRMPSVVDCGVVAVLRNRLGSSKTFGENIIFMLNRCVDPTLQLLILKLLYLLFTSGPDLAEFFYTNDLHVLMDVFIRELSDLPFEAEAIRNTFLRVLPPLLTMTQLRSSGYKKKELAKVLNGLARQTSYRDVSATTQRLVGRCIRLPWFQDDPAIAGQVCNSTEDSPAPSLCKMFWRDEGGSTTNQVYGNSSINRSSSTSIDSVAAAAPRRKVTPKSTLTREYI